MPVPGRWRSWMTAGQSSPPSGGSPHILNTPSPSRSRGQISSPSREPQDISDYFLLKIRRMGLPNLLQPAIKLGGRYPCFPLSHHPLHDLEYTVDPLTGDS